MGARILFVDDDPRLLRAVKCQLQERFEVDTALGPEPGLAAIAAHGPYAVVVSDMRMPGMNGIQFLGQVHEATPDTVRVMLTSYSDIGTATEAINKGQIFRFLNKPCSAQQLAETLEQALEQYRLVHAERELLSRTLTGSVKALIDVLALNNPVAFGRASRVRRIVTELAARLGMTDTWEYEIASLLSQIGLIAVPDTIWAKVRKGEWLSPQERNILQGHPQVAKDLLANIPRLNDVAEIVAYQNKRFDGMGLPDDGRRGEEIPLGARLLKLVMDFEMLIANGGSADLVMAEIRDRRGYYDPKLVAVLEQFVGIKPNLEVAVVTLDEIPEGAILTEDVVTSGGETIVAAGAEINPAVRMRLRAHLDTCELNDRFSIHAAPHRANPPPTADSTPVDLLA